LFTYHTSYNTSILMDTQIQTVEQLEQSAHDLMKEKKFESAADLFSQVLTKRITEFGETSENVAPLYHYYGKCLLYSAQDELTELGSIVRENVKDILASKIEESTEEVEVVNDESEVKEEEQDLKTAMTEAAQSIEVATENLEVAKAIYEKNESKYRTQLAEIYMLTADIHMDTEMMEEAEKDYLKCLELKKELEVPEDRTIAGIYYSLAITLQHQNKNKEATPHLQTAKRIMEASINKAKELNDTETTKELEGALTDLVDKLGQCALD